MNILVTGGAGYVGSVVIRQLLDNGHSVAVFDNLSFGGEAIVDLLGINNFRLMHGDIRKKEQVQFALKGVDCVVHLAAIVGEPACAHSPKEAQEVNYQGSKNVCDCAKHNRVKRYIHISTCSNYGISEKNHPATEKSPLHPISLYAQTKIAAEKYLLTQTGPDFNVCILRLSTVFGISPRMRFDLLVNEIVRDAFLYKKIVLYQPHAWRPFLHVSDVGRAIISCINAQRDTVNGQIFNVGDNNYQKSDIVKAVKKYIPECIEETIDKARDKRDYCVSFEKINKLLNFQAKSHLAEGIEEILNALRIGIFKDSVHYRYTNVGWPAV